MTLDGGNRMGKTWTLTLEVEYARESSKTWIATCPALNVASHGQTKKEAYQMIREALEGFFEDCLANETLWQVLEDSGLTPSRSSTVSTEKPVAPRRREAWRSIPIWILPPDARSQASVH